jgi:outer membrane protein
MRRTMPVTLVIILICGAGAAWGQENASADTTGASAVSADTSGDPAVSADTTKAATPGTRANYWQIGTVRQDTLFVDLRKVLYAALTRNEMLAAASAMEDAAAGEALAAWSGFLPRIQLGEFFFRSDDALMAFGMKLQNRRVTPADFNPQVLNYPGETNNFVTRLMLMQPIFNGGMGLYGKQAANAASRAAGYQYQRARETVVFQAIQAFEGLALAEAFASVMSASVASAEGHVRQAQAMVDAEMATAADLLQATVFSSGLQQQLIEIRNMIAVAGENIKLMTAIDTDLPLAAASDLRDDFGQELPAVIDTTDISLRSDLLAHHERKKAAGSMVGVARGAMLPHINLSIQRDLYSHDDIFGDDARSWTLGVFGTWDIFQGLEGWGNLKKARAEARAAEFMLDFETRRAGVEATEAWLGAQAANEKVMVAGDAVTAAREGLRIVTNQYREGLATMVNLLDTQAAATMAEGNLVQAMHDYNVGLARLRFAGVGKTLAPSEQELQELSASSQIEAPADR